MLASHGLPPLMSCKGMSELHEAAAFPSAAKPQLTARHDLSKGGKCEGGAAWSFVTLVVKLSFKRNKPAKCLSQHSPGQTMANLVQTTEMGL